MDALMLPEGRPKTIKEAIILVLSSEWPLNTRNIHTSIKKKYGFSVTYQAVYKVIQELMSNSVIIKEGKEYSIDPEWANRIEDFGKLIKRSCEKVSFPTVEEVSTRGSVSLRFEDLNVFYEFVVDFALKVARNYSKEATVQFNYLYWPFTASKKTIKGFENALKSYDGIYMISPSNSPLNRVVAKVYDTLTKNVHIKLGVDKPGDFDMIVAGDFIVQIYFTEKIKKTYKDAHSRSILDPISLSKVSYTIFNDKAPVNVVILKNRYLARQITNRILGYFK